MKPRTAFYLAVAACLLTLTGADAAHKLSTVQEPPAGLPEKIAAAIEKTGYVVEGESGPVVRIWLAKQIPLKPDFSPTLAVKYPLAPGQFVGVLQVTGKTTFTDFRGQEIGEGLYTLRYGQQPMDGNHIGTSELRDFLLALPVKIDGEPAPIKIEDTLHTQSAKAAGSTHPAIYSLLPAEKTDKAKLTHDEDKDFWILSVTAEGRAGEKAVKLPLRIVVIGLSEI